MKDLTDIFKNMKVGTKLFSPICGEVAFCRFDKDATLCIKTIGESGYTLSFDKFGRYFINKDAPCLLFPSNKFYDWDEYEKKNKNKTPKTWKSLKDIKGYYIDGDSDIVSIEGPATDRLLQGENGHAERKEQ